MRLPCSSLPLGERQQSFSAADQRREQEEESAAAGFALSRSAGKRKASRGSPVCHASPLSLLRSSPCCLSHSDCDRTSLKGRTGGEEERKAGGCIKRHASQTFRCMTHVSTDLTSSLTSTLVPSSKALSSFLSAVCSLFLSSSSLSLSLACLDASSPSAA